ncbi:MAG: hypothetical protein JXR48_08550 [Candidatus Delongbacteria bacterium]|nr:hypothetical protein [Candidatus Delongbacteria bacterium]MBN2835002.1 hypothetical protein [Candidatus Delongbacteria bacterium]
MIVFCPGNVDKDNGQHKFLLDNEYNWSVFETPGDGLRRKYWKIVDKKEE